ncbi:alcohol dehydrogenase catalytic domain-containing protein [Nonomuraea sp. C10]|uniref:quinone oxidoreductase family protein n=1 Tax=Nonomuraea sp. C10 TaxID=2600577 RepID=UPI0028FCB590|nr:alcohol dehydrogenase catalytic domain-containing protein [Nonomuraea sp. C10]
MRAMRQAAWGEAEAMALVEVEEPVPVFGEVLVRVMAAGVNPVDVFTRRGQAYNRVLDLPFVNGWDVAGTVVRTGYGTTRFRPGDRVFGMPWFPRAAGCYAEYVTAPARHFARMPEGLGFTEAAALPLAGLTAWQMLTEVAAVAPGTAGPRVGRGRGRGAPGGPDRQSPRRPCDRHREPGQACLRPRAGGGRSDRPHDRGA